MPIVIRRKPAAPPPPAAPPAPTPALVTIPACLAREPTAPIQALKTRPLILNELFDPECRAALALHPDSAVSWWLMASYAYYVVDTPIITDGQFDRLTAAIRANRASLTHKHAPLITDAMLDAGSGYNLSHSDYPGQTRGAAGILITRLQAASASRN